MYISGVAIIFCYINQLFLFSACLAVNENRIYQNRHFLCCRPTKTKQKMIKDGESKRRIFCCAGQEPISRNDVEGFPEKLPKKYLSRFVTWLPAKVSILIFFACYLGLSIWGSINLEQGLVIRNLVSDDSYFFKYSQWQEEIFPDSQPISFNFAETLQYHSGKVQSDIDKLISSAQNNPFISNKSYISWLNSYKVGASYNNTTEIDFVNGLKIFLGLPQNNRFKNDVVISGNSVKTSRIYVFTGQLNRSQDQGQMMMDMRDVTANLPLSVIAFAPSFIFYEQYVAILPQTFQTLGISVAAVFVVTAFFMPHPILLLFVVLSMGMIMTGILGFMYFWDLTLSSITMVHLIMSVGFSVDFTAHVCHAYMVSDGESRNERVKGAITLAGGPIFNGAVSSVIGIIMLSLAKSYIFKSFFKVMFLVIMFGAMHALFLLPVVLSLIGPRPSKQINEISSPNRTDKNIYELSPEGSSNTQVSLGLNIDNAKLSRETSTKFSIPRPSIIT